MNSADKPINPETIVKEYKKEILKYSSDTKKIIEMFSSYFNKTLKGMDKVIRDHHNGSKKGNESKAIKIAPGITIRIQLNVEWDETLVQFELLYIVDIYGSSSHSDVRYYSEFDELNKWSTWLDC